jgi:hypothetical protein
MKKEVNYMPNKHETEIKTLKEQIAILTEQKRILMDAVDIVSMADGIIFSLQKNDFREAIEKVEYIKSNALSAMSQVAALRKPSGA